MNHRTISHYLAVTKRELLLSQQSAFEYRADYLLRLIRAGFDVFFIVIVISTFYAHTDQILGWSRWEALIVYAFYQIISALVFIFCGYGITHMPQMIVRGQLDSFLLKPMDSQFLVSTKVIYLTNIFRLLAGVFVLIYSILQLSSPIAFSNVIVSLIAFVAAIIIYFSIVFGASSLTFWTFTPDFGNLVTTITSVSRLPTDFYPRAFRLLFFIIPISFIATVPAQALLGKAFYPALISPFIALICLMMVRKIWNLGLKSYQSVSS